MDSVRPKRLKKRQTGRVGAVEAEFFNGLLEDVLGYEQLIADEQPLDWPQFDENAGAVLCYTSGTTGDPKGVLYSHRSVVLHTMAAGLSGAFGLSASIASCRARRSITAPPGASHLPLQSMAASSYYRATRWTARACRN